MMKKVCRSPGDPDDDDDDDDDDVDDAADDDDVDDADGVLFVFSSQREDRHDVKFPPGCVPHDSIHTPPP